MKRNYLMWLIGGAALYFLTRKKAVEPSTDKPSADVGNQANDFPQEGGTKASLPPTVPNNAPSTVVVAAPKVNPVVVDVRPNAAVGTPPQTPTNLSKNKYSID
jgi:hypothetical protein